MDIERMHSMIEKLSESALSEFEKGIGCVDTCEMGAVIDMIKDLAEAEYYATLAKTMQESDTEDVLAMLDRYGDRRYYSQNYRMTPEMYRDMDRDTGKMYYADANMPSNESRYDKARRHYTETKELHRGNTAEDKEHKMRDLEKLMQELATDITELVADASTEERALLRQKLQVLAQKIQ